MMRNLRVRRGGFTLIELMITVAIIGILAAIAVPRFVAYQHRSKRTEAMMNLEAIAKSEVAYFATNGVYFDAAPMPGGAFGPKRVWSAVAHAEFDELGYMPEGAVWYDYDANATVGCGCPIGANGAALCFTATAYSDVDEDGSIALVTYFHPDPVGNLCTTGLFGAGPPPDPSSGNPVLSRPMAYPPTPGVSDDF
jgi:type IV pilus assembly protein PilA